MNKTLQLLALSYQSSHSPLFSLTDRSSPGTMKLRDLYFHHFLSSAVYGTLRGSFSFKNSDLSDFLNTAVHLTSIPLERGDYSQERPVFVNSVVEVDDMSFIRCRANSSLPSHAEGGALFLHGIIASIAKSLFRQCAAYMNGGAVRVLNSAKFAMETCIFAENLAARFCGALSLYNVYEAFIQKTNFTLNNCSGQCAALAITKTPDCKIKDLNFLKNQAFEDGTFFTEYATVTAESLHFSQNIAQRCSAVYAGDQAQLTTKDSIFSDDNKTSIYVSGQCTVTGSNFAGEEKTEIVNQQGDFKGNDNAFQQMVELKLPPLPELPPEAKGGTILSDSLPSIQSNDEPLPTFNTLKGGISSFDKSTFMIIAYSVVIGLLILGLRMYLGSTPNRQVNDNNNSLFVDGDEGLEQMKNILDGGEGDDELEDIGGKEPDLLGAPEQPDVIESAQEPVQPLEG